MTPVELADKIEWEGGVLAALVYGLGPDDLDDSDPDLKAAWVALWKARDDIPGLVEAVESQLPDTEDDFDYEE